MWALIHRISLLFSTDRSSRSERETLHVLKIVFLSGYKCVYYRNGNKDREKQIQRLESDRKKSCTRIETWNTPVFQDIDKDEEMVSIAQSSIDSEWFRPFSHERQRFRWNEMKRVTVQIRRQINKKKKKRRTFRILLRSNDHRFDSANRSCRWRFRTCGDH